MEMTFKFLFAFNIVISLQNSCSSNGNEDLKKSAIKEIIRTEADFENTVAEIGLKMHFLNMRILP